MASTLAPRAAPALSPQAERLRGALSAMPLRRAALGLGHGLLAAFVFFACFAFPETASPYDAVALPTMGLWLLLGIRLHRGALPFVGLMILYVVGIGSALMPYLDESFPVTWTIQLVYLVVTGVFFAMLFSQDSARRMGLALGAYTASCLFSAVLGIGGYLGLIGNDELFRMYGRASGTFQDPNVFGSFLTLGALYLLHGLLAGTARRPLANLAGLGVLLAGIFLSFSRGSWGGTVVAIAMMGVSVYASAGSARLRRRMVLAVLASLALTLVAFAALLSIDQVAASIQDRAALTKDYDEGETGRFGNQLRGAGILLGLPMGMGPMHWRLTFGIEPHNSYLGSFANGGWLGGAVFILLVASTLFVGFRLMSRDTPFRAHAQVVVPALTMFFLQAAQIDIEKWRHVYMMLGMVWGLEAARLLWLRDAGIRSTRAARSAGPGRESMPRERGVR